MIYSIYYLAGTVAAHGPDAGQNLFFIILARLHTQSQRQICCEIAIFVLPHKKPEFTCFLRPKTLYTAASS